MTGVAPRQSPPLRVVAPFFVLAPLGLVAAGLLLVAAGSESFMAVNTPRLVAATHGLVLGWLTLTIMGAVYQLGPAVFGGRLLSTRLAQVQLVTHLLAVGGFIAALEAWNVPWMSVAGIGVVVSFALFLVNAIPGVRWFRGGSLPRLYISVALLFLVGTAALGLTFVGTLEHLWFPVTQGRLSGHAHLGLVGWLALMIMGTSHQLVPMFQVVPRETPRFGRVALGVTALAALMALIGFSLDPPPAARFALAAALAVGPALWAADITRMLWTRSRRRVDLHTRATVVSLAFLAAGICVGLMAAVGEPLAPGGEPARLQLAYGALAIGGWAGITLIGNSFKIVPFLVWNARYRQLAGLEPVPMVAELSNSAWAHATLTLHALGVVLIAAGALLGDLSLLRSGGLVIAASGASHAGAMVSILVHRPQVRASERTPIGPLRI